MNSPIFHEAYTLQKPLVFEGVGLHRGTRSVLQILPAQRPGFWLRQTHDAASQRGPAVPITVAQVTGTRRCTAVAGVDTVEHVLAALYALGYSAAELRLTGEEFPILDGSALPFAEALHQSPRQKLSFSRPVLAVASPFTLNDLRGVWQIHVAPWRGLRLDYTLDFALPGDHGLRYQAQGTYRREQAETAVTDFLTQVAPARTFVFAHEVAALKQAGQALGGSLDNAVVLDGQAQPLQPLRLPHEPVQHKLLDLCGDLALLGPHIDVHAHIQVVKGGHTAHVTLVQHLQQLYERRENA